LVRTKNNEYGGAIGGRGTTAIDNAGTVAVAAAAAAAATLTGSTANASGAAVKRAARSITMTSRGCRQRFVACAALLLLITSWMATAATAGKLRPPHHHVE